MDYTTMKTEDRINIYKAYENEFLSKSVLPQLEQMGFFTAPASTKYHGAYEGGLFDHCLNVFKRLADITIGMNLKWKREASPFIVGMFHDLCKCDQYRFVESSEKDPNPHWEYTDKTVLAGHGPKSVMILSTMMDLTEEEMLCIRYHMGAYETTDWDCFDRAIRRWPTVLWTHTADMLASKIDET